MDKELKAYDENMEKPWGKMFYKLIWKQLPEMNNLKILDFGSGLGVTANHLAKNNDVIAIEPNNDMVKMRRCENNYEQITGGIEQLRSFKENSFDVVICHNVFEYAKDRKDIFKELCRVVKYNGIISIIKHNHAGRVMAKAVFENNLDDALRLLDGGVSRASYFGDINYYEVDDIKEWIGDFDINIEKVLGIRTFFALHSNNEVRYDPDWQEKMFEMEMKASEISNYVNIAFSIMYC